MNSKTQKIQVADSYLALINAFPLRLIRSHDEYDLAVAVMKKLAIRGEDDLDEGEGDYLDALSEFISIYDKKHFAFPKSKRTARDRLNYLMDQSETTPAQLKEILGCTQPLVSMILGGQRELSKENVIALARHFKMDPKFFLAM